MSSGRFFQYDLSDERAKLAKAQTQAVCDRFGVNWAVQLRQKDLFAAFKNLLGSSAQQETGLCQVLSVMYANIRDVMLGYQDVARVFFQCWCTRDREGVKAVLKELPPVFNAEKILHDYFDDRGAKSFVAVTDELGGGMSARMTVARKLNAGEPLHVHQRTSAEQPVYRERKHKDLASTVDIDFVHACNPDYLATKNEVYIYLRHYEEVAEAIMQQIDPYMLETQPMRCTIQLNNANEPKIETQHMMSLLKLPDSNYLELTDANRGVFFIPCNNRVSVKLFFVAYLQAVYSDYKFNTVHAEHFARLAELPELSEAQRAQYDLLLVRAEERKQPRWRAKL